MTDLVVIIKLISGDELICILLNDLNSDVVKVQFPYLIKYSPKINEVLMIPFCLLSSEEYFEFKRDQVIYCVTPIQSIAENYLSLINKTQAISIEEIKSQLDELGKSRSIEPETKPESIRIKGTNTKH